MADEIRTHVVDALVEAVQDPELSDEVTRQMLMDATPAERQAVAERHAHLADLSIARATALAYVIHILKPWWESSGGTLNAALKVAPQFHAERALRVLYAAGYGEQDGLPPLTT